LKTSTLVFAEDTWSELTSVLEAQNEAAAVLVARPARSLDHLTLLVRKIVWVPEDDVLVRSSDGLEIRSHGYMRGLKAAVVDSSAAIFFHSHPGARSAQRSQRDHGVDSSLRELFQNRTGSDLYGSLVLAGAEGSPSFDLSVWDGTDLIGLTRIRVVGKRLRLFSRAAAPVASADIFDRQIRMFGAAGQQMLSELRVGVVGAGGTGSAVFEQLVRLGIREIVVIDDDRLSRDNVSRVYGSGLADVGVPKVAIAAANAKRIGLGTNVTVIEGRVTEESVAGALTQCDVIFGCTDDHAGRIVLSRLAYWYLAPVFDMGFLVWTDEAHVTGLFGRVTSMIPGEPCLICRRRIDLGMARAEVLLPEERERLRREGYVPGLDEPAAALIPFTAAVASLALNELLGRMIGYLSDGPGEVFMYFHDRQLRRIQGHVVEGHFCGDRDAWGRGDETPRLGMTWP